MNSRQLQTQVEGPRVSPDERDVLRLIASAARRARAIFVAEAVAWAAVAAAAAFALTARAAVLGCAIGAWLTRGVPPVGRQEAVTVGQLLIPPPLLPPSSLRVVATIQPPAYTGLPTRTLTDPAQIDAVEGSVANVV